MTLSKKILFGGLGWALGGPIGAIIGLFLASQETKEYSGSFHTSSNEYPRTKPGDFYRFSPGPLCCSHESG